MIPHESTWVLLFGENLNLARLPIPPRGQPQLSPMLISKAGEASKSSLPGASAQLLKATAPLG